MEAKNELGPDLEALAELEKVRDILFGASLRGVDTRLRDIDAETARALQVLRDDVRQRFEALERRLDEHVAALAARLDGQQADKVDRDQLAGLLNDLAERVARRPENGQP